MRGSFSLLAMLVVLEATLASGCTPMPTPQPPASPSATPVLSPVVVPTVSTKTRSKLLINDPTLVFKRDEQLPQAPNSFAVVNGQLIMNDYLHDVFAIYQDHQRIKEFAKPTNIGDFVVRDNHYYLLEPNFDATLYTVGIYNHTAKGLKKVREIKLPEIPADEAVYDRLYFEGPNLIARAENRVLVEGPGPLRDEPQFNDLKHAIHFTDGNINATVPLKYDRNGGAERIALNDKHVYYLISDWKDDNPISVFRQFILQFTLDGQLVHTYAVQPGNEGATPMEFLVADDKLYQMWISNKTVKVFLLEPNDN